MSELEQLIQQKKEIQKKINEIKRHGVRNIGMVKIDRKKYTTHSPLWTVSILCDGTSPWEEFRKKSWRTILIKETRDDVIKEIPQIIEDLQNLYNMEVKS